MGDIHLTGDTHFFHYNKFGGILAYAHRPFPDIKTHNECIVDNWNSQVKVGDTVIIDGDLSFGSVSKTKDILRQLHGKKIMVVGDHDKQVWQCREFFEEITPYKTITVGKYFIVIFHWCIRNWQRSHYNSYHAFAHCLDLETEVLTDTGWKFRDELKQEDKIMTLNLNNKMLEYNEIDEFLDYPYYTGKVCNIKSKSLDLRVTGNHVLIETNYSKSKYRKFNAEDFLNRQRRSFIRSGILPKQRLNISNNFLRLLVWIAADGNICNSNLVRLRVLKDRKKNRIKELLSKLNIKFNELPQKDGSVSFNFNIPVELGGYRYKPLDITFTKLNFNQLEIVLNEYSVTDGYRNGNCILIYTSKKEESDIIQEACITSGYQCYIRERKDGFAKKINYELTISRGEYKSVGDTRKAYTEEIVSNEYFWCLKVKNQTMFIRRKGKPIIVGNSHGGLPPIGKSWDVGVDTECDFGDIKHERFFPYHIDEFLKIMEHRPNNPNYIKDRKKK